jgi:hypothetical protein
MAHQRDLRNLGLADSALQVAPFDHGCSLPGIEPQDMDVDVLWRADHLLHPCPPNPGERSIGLAGPLKSAKPPNRGSDVCVLGEAGALTFDFQLGHTPIPETQMPRAHHINPKSAAQRARTGADPEI